jgi:hypothetical protein
METPMGPLDGLPTWVKSVAFVGFPAFIAVFLLAQNAGLIGDRSVAAVAATRQVELQADHAVKVQEIAENLAMHRQRQEELIRTLKIALRVICENQAFSLAQKNNCRNIQ